MRRIISVIGALVLLGFAASTVLAGGVHKSYICKYVGTPGVDEVLQTGQNPIFTDNHSLLGHDGTTFVGQQFSDKHGRSIVIVANTEKLDPEPSVEQCPSNEPTPTLTPTPEQTYPESSPTDGVLIPDVPNTAMGVEDRDPNDHTLSLIEVGFGLLLFAGFLVLVTRGGIHGRR